MAPPDNHTCDFMSHPLVETVGWNERSARAECLPENAVGGNGFRTRINRVKLVLVPRPVRNQPPLTRLDEALPLVLQNVEHRKSWRDVVARSGSIHGNECPHESRQLGGVGMPHETTAHETIILLLSAVMPWTKGQALFAGTVRMSYSPEDRRKGNSAAELRASARRSQKARWREKRRLDLRNFIARVAIEYSATIHSGFRGGA